jgi:hypothetical protein
VNQFEGEKKKKGEEILILFKTVSAIILQKLFLYIDPPLAQAVPFALQKTWPFCIFVIGMLVR